MKSTISKHTFGVALAAVTLLFVTLLTDVAAQSKSGGSVGKPVREVVGLPQMKDSARQQIRELLAEKQARTPAQRKIGSSLIYRINRQRGVDLLPNVSRLRPLVAERRDGMVQVQISGRITKALITSVERAGGKVLYGHVNGPLLKALVPLSAVETLAARSDVYGIREALSAATQQQLAKYRAEALRDRINSAVQLFNGKNDIHASPMALDDRGSVVSEGVKAHRADEAVHLYGVTGAGVKIGVLSDSDDFKEDAIASGDLPADTVTVPGQDGRPGNGEGTAMMEIVHDMAPGAKLFFASAFNSPESFADNIRTLRFTYGCNIIVDDVIYYFESPYEDDIIAHAVNDVTADGALYFSSAGNQGNFNDGTSGTWEGDFKKAKSALAAVPGYEIHDFGKGVISDRIEVGGGPLILHWSDPGSLDNGQAADDYDLFVLDQDLRNVAVASTDVQDGTEIPFEFLGFNIPSGYQVVIARHPGATDRAVRIELFSGELAMATAGGSYGHSATVEAYAVAAVDVAEAPGGVFAAGPTTPVELFSSDGNRRLFFDQNGNAYKPGKYLFKNSGGQLRKKVDLAAADGVSTTLPSTSGLNPFFGTSAAAPHAAAIAGLLKSAKPLIKSTGIRAALRNSALDIEANGRDVDSGWGIPDAVAALNSIHATPEPFLELNAVTATETIGDGDGFIEPGESANLTTQLQNVGGASTVNLHGTMSTVTAGVTINNASSTFPSIPAFGGTGSNNTPFSFTLAPTAICGLAPQFTLTATFNGPGSPETFDFKVQTGKPGTTPTPVSYTGPAVAIPDGNAAGVDIPLTVSSVPGAISKLTFSLDGSSCTTDVGATTVGLDHSWVGDLIATLTSPSGTTVTLFSRPGGTGNSGNNFCNTVLDDSASNSIQAILSTGAPYTGSFKPASPLAAFQGEDPNGTWTLHVSDNVVTDTGSVRAFSLNLTGFSCD